MPVPLLCVSLVFPVIDLSVVLKQAGTGTMISVVLMYVSNYSIYRFVMFVKVGIVIRTLMHDMICCVFVFARHTMYVSTSDHATIGCGFSIFPRMRNNLLDITKLSSQLLRVYILYLCEKSRVNLMRNHRIPYRLLQWIFIGVIYGGFYVQKYLLKSRREN